MADKHRIFLDKAPPIQVRQGVVHFLDTCAMFGCDHAMAIETLAEVRDRIDCVLRRYTKGERDIFEG